MKRKSKAGLPTWKKKRPIERIEQRVYSVLLDIERAVKTLEKAAVSVEEIAEYADTPLEHVRKMLPAVQAAGFVLLTPAGYAITADGWSRLA